MVHPAPATGVFDGNVHRFPVRVYFEDTDLSGVVYHANYLRFMERARSDMLAHVGIDQRAAFDGESPGEEGVYAVAELSIKYRRPARLDDALTIVSRVRAVGGATATIHQAVMCGDELLSDATVVAAFLTREGRPRRQPQRWVEAFRKLVPSKQENA